jgi:hypothetical protein
VNPARAWPLLALLAIASPVRAHDWFTDKVAPDGHRSCCGGSDCSVSEVRLNPDTGQEEILLNHKWWPLEDPRWFLGETLDPSGAPAGCMMPGDEQPRCTWIGQGA